jgi:hypothetical protein
VAAGQSAAAPTIVVFDVGKVLVDWDPRAFFARHIDDPARLDRFLSQIATEAWHTQHDAGRDFADTSAELIARHPEEADNIRRWGECFVETLGYLVPGMADLVADLRTRPAALRAGGGGSAVRRRPAGECRSGRGGGVRRACVHGCGDAAGGAWGRRPAGLSRRE